MPHYRIKVEAPDETMATEFEALDDGAAEKRYAEHVAIVREWSEHPPGTLEVTLERLERLLVRKV